MSTKRAPAASANRPWGRAAGNLIGPCGARAAFRWPGLPMRRGVFPRVASEGGGFLRQGRR
eukprot:11198261-Lingulodinium_polyedra.AAC.1